MATSKSNLKLKFATNKNRLIGQIMGGFKKFSVEAINKLRKVIVKTNNKMVKDLQKSDAWLFLTSSTGQGRFGFASPEHQLPEDTNPDDLLRVLLTEGTVGYRLIQGIRRGSFHSLKFRTVSILTLKRILKHNLTRLKGGEVASPGPRVSWFAWFESGDRGFIKNRTVFKFELLKKKARVKRKKATAISVLKALSRSREAIQSKGVRSGIEGTHLIENTYRKYEKIHTQILTDYIHTRLSGSFLTRILKFFGL